MIGCLASRSQCAWPLHSCVNQALENETTVFAAQERLAGSFRVRHEAGHVAAFVADAGDVLQRTVGVSVVVQFALRVAVLPKDLVVGLHLHQRIAVGEVTAFPVSNGHVQQLTLGNLRSEWRIARHGLEENVLAAKLERAVADESAGQQVRLAKHLETVADADDQPTVVGELLHGLHHRAEACDGPAAQVISVTKAAGHDDRVDVA